mgnify:CR=1 FL=1
MFCYMTVQETAKLWGTSERQSRKLCKANRLEGVIHLTHVWLILRDIEKPADMRRQNLGEMEK